MAGFVLLCNLLYTIAGTAVAIRLLRLSKRTGGAPERIIGTGLLSFSLFCQPLLVVASGGFGHLPLWGHRLVMTGALLSSAICVLCLYLFCWRVFRPEAAWARLAVAAGSLVTLVVSVGLWLQPPVYADQPTNPLWMALSSFNYVACFVWAGAESSVYYLRLRRRAGVGLGDPELQNRFGVWGATMLCGASLSLVIGVVSLMGLRIGIDPLPSLCVAASGLINSAGWWLSFAPPATYLGWVRSRAGA